MNSKSTLPPFHIDICRGRNNCPYKLIDPEETILLLEEALQKRLEGQSVSSYHKMIRFALSCCPNSCSQPQIRDFGLQGRVEPIVTHQPCNSCQACLKACPEGFVQLTAEGPQISEQCLACGHCIDACPTGTLDKGKSGWTLLIGGKLGRIPSLAIPVAHFLSTVEVIQTILSYLDPYLAAIPKEVSRKERFRAWLDRTYQDSIYVQD
ncbi:hypothetical protein F9B85_07100 [Heliorestis acidaminivorans]|uniref:4Fe-4S ferredoxin-type domain-containing protein n=1 Tax=Heliorestis acidaminivorans TaxID=553427 RepID=A0A6I0F6U5_9FIRM|nr:4Fe-4S dicluster domain-containing protein [Heliorestis acidaminivorans]KAB2953022.1 hypothetical protein F9B85_07100 [Heliorestis acidaminivorans]